jgi:hypothetical protein
MWNWFVLVTSVVSCAHQSYLLARTFAMPFWFADRQPS